MLWGGLNGSLELRSEGGATRLTARFPYDRETEIAPGRLELIAVFVLLMPRFWRA